MVNQSWHVACYESNMVLSTNTVKTKKPARDAKNSVSEGRSVELGGVQDVVVVRMVMRPNDLCPGTGRELTVRDTDSLAEALRTMRVEDCDRLSVLDKNGIMVGWVTWSDIVSRLSPERLYIDLNAFHDDQNILRHKARYIFAANHIHPMGAVLDCACGSGYGSAILAERAEHVIGVDNSTEANTFAKSHYLGKPIQFHLQNIEELDFNNDSLDSVVSLETLEHLPQMVAEQFLMKINGWLRPGGMLVASSPMLRYRNGLPYVTSPYHVNELPKKKLLETFERCLPKMKLTYYHQKEQYFSPLNNEDTGFCVVVAEKK